MCKTGFLDDGKLGLNRGGLSGDRCRRGFHFHRDRGALSGQAVWSLDAAGVGRKRPCVVGRGRGAPATAQQTTVDSSTGTLANSDIQRLATNGTIISARFGDSPFSNH